MFVLGRIFPAIIGEMSTLRDAEEFEAFFSTHPAVGAERSVKQSSEAVRIKAARLQREIPIIREWLEKHPL